MRFGAAQKLDEKIGCHSRALENWTDFLDVLLGLNAAALDTEIASYNMRHHMDCVFVKGLREPTERS